MSINNSSAKKNLEETRTIIPSGCSSGKRDSSQVIFIDREQEPPSKKQLAFDGRVMASNSLTPLAPLSNTVVGHQEITLALPNAISPAIDDFSSFGDYFIAGADGEVDGNYSLPPVTTYVRPPAVN